MIFGRPVPALPAHALVEATLHRAAIIRRAIARNRRGRIALAGGGFRRGRVLVHRPMGDELLVPGSTRSRRRVAGQAAGPMRPTVGDKRATRPESKAETKHYRGGEEAGTDRGRRVACPIRVPIGSALRALDHAMRSYAGLPDRPTGMQMQSFHGLTVSVRRRQRPRAEGGPAATDSPKFARMLLPVPASKIC